MRLIDEQHVGHQFAHDRQRQLADILDRDAFGQRRPADRQIFAAQRVAHRRIERGLDADDLNFGPQTTCRNGDAGNQPAAADRNDQHIEIGTSASISSAIVPCPAMIAGSS